MRFQCELAFALPRMEFVIANVARTELDEEKRSLSSAGNLYLSSYLGPRSSACKTRTIIFNAIPCDFKWTESPLVDRARVLLEAWHSKASSPHACDAWWNRIEDLPLAEPLPSLLKFYTL